MQRLLLNTVVVLGSLALAAAPARPARAQTPAGSAAPAAAVKVGEPAPAFSLAASDGTTHRLAELRGRKRLVLVIFRGVW